MPDPGHVSTRPPASEVRRRVLQGAAWLDEVLPGWHDQVDVQQLDIRDFGVCITGQLWGDWAIFKASMPALQHERDGGTYEELGLQADDKATYAELTAVWRDLVAARQGGADAG